MPTLLLKLVGPMQSWGSTSRFDERDTNKEPSKSGVIGLLAAALGIDRENWEQLKPLTQLRMVVRHDRPGIIKREYQTAGCANPYEIIKADGSLSDKGITSVRYYLADAAFLVGLECDDRQLLESIHSALQNPVWPLSLGRKSYVPSEDIWVNEGLQKESLSVVMLRWPWIATLRKYESFPEKLLISFESDNGEGILKMDQPLSSFSSRYFGARYVKSEWISFPKEVADVTA
jgi:CRISPR system Cascade subunit CasD